MSVLHPGAFPPVEELLPHAGRMLLVDRVLSHVAEETVCKVRAARSRLFRNRDGRVPAWVALEWMAQGAAVHGALAGPAAGGPARLGLLVGTRRLRLAVATFEPNAELQVVVRPRGAHAGLVAFDCAVRETEGAAPLVEGRLGVHLMAPSEAQAVLAAPVKAGIDGA